MSIIRFVNDRNREVAQLCNVLQYVTRGGKLSDDCMSGQGISPDTAYADMLAAKHMFHQAKGKQYMHLIVSCDQVMREKDSPRNWKGDGKILQSLSSSDYDPFRYGKFTLPFGHQFRKYADGEKNITASERLLEFP